MMGKNRGKKDFALPQFTRLLFYFNKRDSVLPHLENPFTMVPTDEKKRTAIDLSPRQENIELDWIYVQQFVLVKQQGNVILFS